MKKKSIISLLLAGVLTIGCSVFAYASNSQSKEKCQNRNSDTTYVQKLVNDGSSLDEARKEALDRKLQKVDEQINNGTISQENGNALKEKLKTNYENCDGSNYQNQKRSEKSQNCLGLNSNNCSQKIQGQKNNCNSCANK